MARRAQIMRFKCGHPGCEEHGRYEYTGRDEATRLQRSYYPDKWRCVRHTRPDEVLSATNHSRTVEMCVFEEPHGKFWGIDRPSNGFVHGPGFKAYAEDFPAGTVIRVTVEVVRSDSMIDTALTAAKREHE